MLSAQPNTSGVLGDKVACSLVKHLSAVKVVPPAVSWKWIQRDILGDPKALLC